MYIFIPISFKTTDEIKYYHFYQGAPKATRKAQTSAFIIQTSWTSLLAFTLLCIFTVIYFYGAISIRDNSWLSFILLEAGAAAFFYLMRKRAWRKLDEQARIEADMNKYVDAALVWAQFDELDRELRKKRQLSDGIFFIIIGLICGVFLSWITISEFTPDEVKDISKSSGSDSSMKGTYYIENLLVLDQYAKAEKGQSYYIALFRDANDKLNFISFSPLLRSKAQTMIDEYMNDDTANIGLKLSVYAKLNSLSEEGKQYTSSLYHYYRSACNRYSQLSDISAEITEINAEYICMGDEDISKAQSPGWGFFLSFTIFALIVLTLMFAGINILRKSLTV